MAPPYAMMHRVRTNDTLNGVVWSNLASTIFAVWRVLQDNGLTAEYATGDFATGSSRAAINFPQGVTVQADGYVTSAFVSNRTAALRGQTYVTLNIAGRDSLAKGYVYTGHDVSMGEFVEPGPAGGHGVLLEKGSADPAAGAEIANQSVPVGAIWRLVSVSVQLVQGITQTPLPTLRIQTGSPATIAQIPITTVAIGASSTAQLTWAVGIVQSSFTAIVGDEFHTAPLPNFLMQTGEIWNTLTDGIGANTNYGAATYLVEEWVIPN